MDENQCKAGYTKIGKDCVPNKKLVVTTTKKAASISKLALIGALVSVGGWALFSSILKITGLTDLNPWLMGTTGLGIIITTTFLGWRKLE